MEPPLATSHAGWGWFALVCYVPEPQKSCLDSLRQCIPGKSLPPAHITLLPPRPLSFSIDHACHHVEVLARGLSAFEAELSEVRCFENTDFLYMDVSAGNESIRSIHAQLNAGELNHPETYEFRPHVTLGGPVPTGSLSAAQTQTADKWKTSGCPRLMRIEELVCLWLDAASGHGDWQRYRSVPLQQGRLPMAATVGIRNQR